MVIRGRSKEYRFTHITLRYIAISTSTSTHGTIKAINSPWLVVLSVRTTVTVDGRVEVRRRKEEDDENDNPTYNQHKDTPISLFQLILKKLHNTQQEYNTILTALGQRLGLALGLIVGLPLGLL